MNSATIFLTGKPFIADAKTKGDNLEFTTPSVEAAILKMVRKTALPVAEKAGSMNRKKHRALRTAGDPAGQSRTQLTVIFVCTHARRATCDFKLGKSEQGDNVFDREMVLRKAQLSDAESKMHK